MELTNERFVDLAGQEVKAGQVPVGWGARGFELIGHGADFALGGLSLQ
jgi:hypothetical protein